MPCGITLMSLIEQTLLFKKGDNSMKQINGYYKKKTVDISGNICNAIEYYDGTQFIEPFFDGETVGWVRDVFISHTKKRCEILIVSPDIPNIWLLETTLVCRLWCECLFSGRGIFVKFRGRSFINLFLYVDFLCVYTSLCGRFSPDDKSKGQLTVTRIWPWRNS